MRNPLPAQRGRSGHATADHVGSNAFDPCSLVFLLSRPAPGQLDRSLDRCGSLLTASCADCWSSDPETARISATAGTLRPR